MEIKVLDMKSGGEIGTKHRLLSVPDGYWVAKATISNSRWDNTDEEPDGVPSHLEPCRTERSWVICPARAKVVKHVAKIFTRSGNCNPQYLWVEDCVWVAPKPFALFVVKVVPGRNGGPRTCERIFISARQVHGGELGKTLPIPDVPVCRGNEARNTTGNWILLCDVVNASPNNSASYVFQEFIMDVPFNWPDKGQSSYVMCANEQALREGDEISFVSLLDVIYHHVWVAAPLAKIYLQLFGVCGGDGYKIFKRMLTRNQ